MKMIRSISLVTWLSTIALFILYELFSILLSNTHGPFYMADNYGLVIIIDIIVGIFSFLVLLVALALDKSVDTKKYMRIILGGILLVGISATMFILYSANNEITDWRKDEDAWKCYREDFKETDPDLRRALSLFSHRTTSQASQETLEKLNRNVAYCIDIVPTDLHQYGAEGVFFFDPNQELHELAIYVDDSYQARDSILTAILLRHEITHVYQYLEELETGVKSDCIENEVEAFTSEVGFILSLNQEELTSLTARIDSYKNGQLANVSDSTAATYEGLWQILTIYINAMNTCKTQYLQTSNEYNACVGNLTIDNVRTLVKSSEIYQEQCNL